MTKFGAIPTELICRFGELTKREIIVLCFLYAVRNGKSEQCNPSRGAIAREVKIAKPHVSVAIKGLEEKGWICEMADGNFLMVDPPEGVTESVTAGVTKSVTEGLPNRYQGVTESVTKGYQIGNEHIMDLNKQRTNKGTNTQNASAIADVDSDGGFLDTVLDGLRLRLSLNTLPREHLWCEQADWARLNNFTPAAFLECFDLLKQQTWRNGRISPDNVAENLPELDKLRAAVKEQTNGKPNSNRRTDADVFAESADFYANYPN